MLATPADLGPAVAVSKVDPPAAAAVKGDLRMVDVLARAVRAHERAPRAGIELWAGRFRLVVEHDRPRRHRRDGQATVEDAQRRPAAGGAPSPAGAGSRVPERPRARPPDRPHRPGRGPVRATRSSTWSTEVRWRRPSTPCGPCSAPKGSCAVSSRRPGAWRSAGPRHPHARRAGRAACLERGRRRMERGRRRPPRRGRRPARARPDATAARRRAPTVARPRGRADPGGAAARLPAVRAPARVPAGRGVRQRPAGLPGVQGHVRHDHPHG